MVPNTKFSAEDVTIQIGGESLPALAPEPRPEHRLAANAILGVLPIDFKRKIQAITMREGMNRKGRKATKTLVRRGIKQANSDRARDKKRLEAREERDRVLFEKIEKRVARGVDKPFPGMSAERYAAIKSAYYRVDSVKIDGEEILGVVENLVKIEQKVG